MSVPRIVHGGADRYSVSGSQDFAGELLDLRRSHDLWTDAEDVSSNLAWAYEKASRDQNIQEGLGKALRSRDYEGMQDTLDDLTRLRWPVIGRPYHW